MRSVPNAPYPYLYYLRRNFDYASVHVTGAQTIANIASQLQIPRLVHVSHLNASYKSESEFYQAKARGEDAVRAAYPEATIVRPGPMFGHEDKLLNSMAVWPMLWTLNHGETKIRPAHVSPRFTRLLPCDLRRVLGFRRCPNII